MPRPPVLAVVGDVHANWPHLDRVLDRIDEVDADAVLLVGDLSCCGHANQRSRATVTRYRKELAGVLQRVRDRGRPFHFVPGNHDLPVLDEPENIDGRVVDVAGLRVLGIGGAGPDILGFAYEWTDAELRARTLPAADIVLCHAPPANTPIDLTIAGQHVGSQALRELAARTHGVMLCGHIHESPGMVRIGDCLCMNVGGLGYPYEAARVGFVQGLDRLVYEDLDAGTRQVWEREGAEVRLPPIGL
ncbi:MAG: metallophosphoesterase family protein [Alphaproteobacteria bacterium]|nr:metallophosphoesterase family protein [Alphaproteobacteria bacterium]